MEDEKRAADLGVRAVRLGVFRPLLAHARTQREPAPVFERALKRTADAQEHVTLDAPMIGLVALRVLDHANTNITKRLRAPHSKAVLALVLRTFNLRPIGSAEWN